MYRSIYGGSINFFMRKSVSIFQTPQHSVLPIGHVQDWTVSDTPVFLLHMPHSYTYSFRFAASPVVSIPPKGTFGVFAESAAPGHRTHMVHLSGRLPPMLRHHGHPCLRPTATTTLAARNSNLIEHVHIGRTMSRSPAKEPRGNTCHCYTS